MEQSGAAVTERQNVNLVEIVMGLLLLSTCCSLTFQAERSIHAGQLRIDKRVEAARLTAAVKPLLAARLAQSDAMQTKVVEVNYGAIAGQADCISLAASPPWRAWDCECKWSISPYGTKLVVWTH